MYKHIDPIESPGTQIQIMNDVNWRLKSGANTLGDYLKKGDVLEFSFREEIQGLFCFHRLSQCIYLTKDQIRNNCHVLTTVH